MAAAHFFNLSVSTTCRYDDAATQLRVTFHPPASLYQPRRLWHIRMFTRNPNVYLAIGYNMSCENREWLSPDCTTVALRWFLLQSRTPLCSSEDSRYAPDSSQRTDYVRLTSVPESLEVTRVWRWRWCQHYQPIETRDALRWVWRQVRLFIVVLSQ